MYNNRRRIYLALFLVFFFLEAIHLFGYLIPVGSPIEWLKPLGHYAPIALAFLLLFIIKIGEVQQEKLEESVKVGSGLISRIDDEGRRLATLSDKTEKLAETTGQIVQQIRSSDALMHGKLLFFQQQYDAACEVFEDFYANSPGDAEASKWLGLSLLRADNPRRAIPLLEHAAKAIANDPELWLSSSTAKFRNWDKSLFARAEEEALKALNLGIKNKEQAEILLAKLQNSRDRSAAKTTLRDSLSRNPGSPPVATELCRMLLEDRDCAGVIEITDRALIISRRNWAMYPLRAEAYLRRGEVGDLARAKADIDEAKRGNPRHFDVHRVEAEYALARAAVAGSQAEARALVAEARDRIAKVSDQFRDANKSRAFALRARLSMRLGDSDDCVHSAQEALKFALNPAPNVQLLLCAALTQKRSWVQLSRAAQHLREAFAVPAFQAWSSLYILLADIHSNQSISTMRLTLQQCMSDLALYPGFNPTARPEWTENSWDLTGDHLAPNEKKLANQLTEFLTGKRSYDAFMADLSAISGPSATMP